MLERRRQYWIPCREVSGGESEHGVTWMRQSRSLYKGTKSNEHTRGHRGMIPGGLDWDYHCRPIVRPQLDLYQVG